MEMADLVKQKNCLQLFYILEEEGMLATDHEDTILYDGREWRTHYWILKKNTILKYAKKFADSISVYCDFWGYNNENN